MRLKEMVVNQRLHDGRTAAAVPPERGVKVAVASSESVSSAYGVSRTALLRGRVYELVCSFRLSVRLTF